MVLLYTYSKVFLSNRKQCVEFENNTSDALLNNDRSSTKISLGTAYVHYIFKRHSKVSVMQTTLLSQVSSITLETINLSVVILMLNLKKFMIG